MDSFWSFALVKSSLLLFELLIEIASGPIDAPGMTILRRVRGLEGVLEKPCSQRLGAWVEVRYVWQGVHNAREGLWTWVPVGVPADDVEANDVVVGPFSNF